MGLHALLQGELYLLPLQLFLSSAQLVREVVLANSIFKTWGLSRTNISASYFINQVGRAVA
jgi:hypothetical protein